MATLGHAKDRKTGKEEVLTLSQEEREQSTYIIGTTGTGKTTLLRNLVIEDMYTLPRDGLCVLDPHGDLTDELLGWVPEDRIEDVVYFNPMDTDKPFGLNLLGRTDKDDEHEVQRDDEHETRWVVSTIMATLHRLFWYSWGPRLEHVLHNVIRTAMTLEGGTFIELLLLLTSSDYRNEIVGTDPKKPGRLDPKKDFLLVNFWYEWFYDLNENNRAEIVSSTLNKISPFLLDTMMRNIIGQETSSIDVRDIMDEGKILLVNLSKGDISENNSALLGSVLVNLILIAALRRRGGAYAQGRRQFHLVVDEYQNFATPGFAVLQSEARKFGVDVIVAHQYRDQLDDESKGASLNVGNFICFRTSGRDAPLLASQFDNTPEEPEPRYEPDYFPAYEFPGYHHATDLRVKKEGHRRPYSDVEAETANDLTTLKNYEALCRLIRRPEPHKSELGEYRMKTFEHPRGAEERSEEEQEAIRRACIQRSREKYGRDRKTVEDGIYRRTGGRIETPTVAASGIVDPD